MVVLLSSKLHDRSFRDDAIAQAPHFLDFGFDHVARF
jgi:hypothetical protein